MISGKKDLPRKTEKNRLLVWGLLLDANQIPIGMKLFPGNQSEKPVIRKVIDDLKKKKTPYPAEPSRLLIKRAELC